MNKLEHKDLKQGIFTSPQSGSVQIKRYIVENKEDLKAFHKKFPEISSLNMYKNLSKCLNDGYIILLTDTHPMTGMPTYCFESDKDNTHPSSMHRLK